jgi:3-phosphoshikimate 1-carboxyvinyltransferase
MRLMAGVLAGQPFESVLTGDASLRRRPMRRITEPLRRMGAYVDGPDDGARAPLTIVGGDLRGIVHVSEVASAQVKSCLMLAGLFASGRLELDEPALSRDHTERMLAASGVDLFAARGAVRMDCGQPVRVPDVPLRVPADVSAAAFFVVGAYVLPGSQLTLPDVGYNETRRGCLEVLSHGYASPTEQLGEERVDLRLDNRYGPGEPLVLRAGIIPRLIDEIPVLAILAARRPGISRIRDAAELRAKESDRIKSTAAMLQAFGVPVRTLPDGMDIHGDPDRPLRGGCTIDAASDHRIAMAAAVGALVADAPVTIRDVEAVETSFPGFLETLEGCCER